MPLHSSLIGRAVRSGRVYLAGKENAAGATAEESSLTACIPLKLDDEVIGAIAIFQLLQHKSALEDLDYEMFDLLATHAATALYCTALHARLRSQEVEFA
jgi:transcriptional regulator with GAF, ATPase, and Fis domain